MQFRDRIRQLRRVPASELRPHPHNWRKHPARQRTALRQVLSQVGFVDAVVARELPDGRLELIDGHLRAETSADELVPVLVVDLNDEEAALVLATHDPLALLAETDGEQLEQVLRSFEFDGDAVEQLLGDVADQAGIRPPRRRAPAAEVEIAESYQVLVDCADEAEQRAVYDLLQSRGYRCRVLTL